MPESRFCQKEGAELKLVENGMYYDEERGQLMAKYPFIFPRELLKGTMEIAFRSMLSTERSLKKDKLWAEVYQGHIYDMQDVEKNLHDLHCPAECPRFKKFSEV